MFDNIIVPLLEFAIILAMTLAIELPFVRVLGIKGDTFKAFVLANVVSNLLLNFLIPLELPIIAGEVAVVVFEYLAVVYAAKPEKKLRTFFIILGANALSALFGFVLLFLL